MIMNEKVKKKFYYANTKTLQILWILQTMKELIIL